MDYKPTQFSDSSTCVSHDFESEPQTASSAFDEKIALAPTREWTTRPTKPRLLGLLPTAALLLMIFGLMALMFRALLLFQCEETQKGLGILAALRIGFFAAVEGHSQDSKSHLWALTISSLTNNLISNTSSIVMTLIAYRIGAEWLRLSDSQTGSNAAETPNPVQYGLLVRLMGSSSITSIGEACVYTARSWNRGRLPRIFRQSLWLAAAVWALSRLVGLADLWLHSVSYSFHNYLSIPTTGAPSMWGVSFNQSICADMESKYGNIQTPSSCQRLYEMFAAWEHWGIDAGLDATTGSLDAAFGVWELDTDLVMNTAVVVPNPHPDDAFDYKAFTIPTFAARASCTSINSLCEKDEKGAVVNCTSAGYPELPYVVGGSGEVSSTGRIQNRIFGVIGGKLLNREWADLNSTSFTENPTSLAVQLQWEPPTQRAGTEDHVHSTGASVEETEMAIDLLPLPTLYANCSLTFLDAFAEWSGRNWTWSLLNTTVASQELASALWLPVIWQHATEQVAANIMYTARRRSKAETMAELSRNIATLSLGAAAGFYKPAEESKVEDLLIVMVAIYPVVPVIALLVLLCTYGLLVLALFLSSCGLPDRSIILPPGADDRSIILPPGADGYRGDELEPSMLTLAQRWLTNPLPLVGFSYPRGDGQDGTRSAAYFAMNSAYDGDEGFTRLAIGLSGETFGVTPWGQRRDDAEDGPEARKI
ncbi:hypothetical protein FRC04_004573 [Tulasnella sp. 424]|nr:hypothetical protein FRC04_004573 [Tulasnella sp. 424]KAG8976642.1 hypothetical protein FRC05_003481 [Tulasnella sp. 425]